MAINTYPISPRDFYFETSNGTMSGQYDGLNTSAYQTANSIGAEADVWVSAGNLVWPVAASTLEVLSSSANDTAAGTGARTVIITGLDINYNVISETIILNGLAAVVTVNSYFRLNRAYVATSGTINGNNIGTLTIQISGGGNIQGQIAPGFGRLAKSHFTVPNGKKFLFRSVTMCSESTKPTSFKVYIRDSTALVAPFGTKQVGLIYPGIVGAFTETFIHEVPLGKGVDIWMTATPSVNNTQLSGDIGGVMVAT